MENDLKTVSEKSCASAPLRENLSAQDCIAAVATAAGPAGVCVVRVSGQDAFGIADRLVPQARRPFGQCQGGTFAHAAFHHPVTREKVDDGLVLVFHAPHSFTGEDVVEFQGHGGTLPSRRLLDAVLAAGARLAEPGEFSKRAFLNGRMDLTQAEAVCDFIQAKTDRIAHVARAQLDGALGSRINRLYDAMTAHCADIEHQLDFEEGELPESFLRQTAAALRETQTQIQRLIESWNTSGHLLRDGALVVISGKPNAGKSSLLNALLGRNRAIVHDAPGTTRDAIEESYALDGIPLRLVDTAGLRDTADAVEQEGVSRAHQFIRQADINLYLIDGTTCEAQDIPQHLDPARTLIVFTKSDLAAQARETGAFESVTLSSKTGEGLDALGRAILGKLGVDDGQGGAEIVNARHADELRTAHNATAHALAALAAPPCDLVIAANHLREAAEALGRIVGRCYADDLLDTIFSRFCVGK